MKILHVSLGDYADKADHLTPEQEGVFWKFLRKMASFDGRLIGDERKAARIMGWDIRYFRRMRAWVLSETDLGMYEDENGFLRNKRIDDEMADYAAAKEKAVAAGKKGAEKRWGNTSTQTSPPTSGVTSTQKSTQKSTNIDAVKSLKNNEPAIATPTPSPTPLKENNNTQPADRNSSAEAGGLAGLERVKLLAEWLTPGHKLTGQALDIAAAQNLIASQVKDVGEVAVERAFIDVQAKLASGEPVGKPVKLWIAICRTHKGAKVEPPKGAPVKFEMRPHERALLEQYNQRMGLQ